MKEDIFFQVLDKGRYKKAKRILDGLKEDLPRKRYLYLDGVLLEKKGDRKEALKRFDMALVLHLSDESLWLAKAKVLMELGRLDMAKRAADRACRLSRDDGVPHLLYSEILYRMNDYTRAMEQIDLAINHGTKTSEVLTLKGVLISILDQDYIEALRYFDSAIEADEEHGRAWTNRGMALLQIGDKDGAAYSFQKALLLDIKDKNARKMLVKMGYEKFIRSIEVKDNENGEIEELSDWDESEKK